MYTRARTRSNEINLQIRQVLVHLFLAPSFTFRKKFESVSSQASTFLLSVLPAEWLPYSVVSSVLFVSFCTRSARDRSKVQCYYSELDWLPSCEMRSEGHPFIRRYEGYDSSKSFEITWRDNCIIYSLFEDYVCIYRTYPISLRVPYFWSRNTRLEYFLNGHK